MPPWYRGETVTTSNGGDLLATLFQCFKRGVVCLNYSLSCGFLVLTVANPSSCVERIGGHTSVGAWCLRLSCLAFGVVHRHRYIAIVVPYMGVNICCCNVVGYVDIASRCGQVSRWCVFLRGIIDKKEEGLCRPKLILFVFPKYRTYSSFNVWVICGWDMEGVL